MSYHADICQGCGGDAAGVPWGYCGACTTTLIQAVQGEAGAVPADDPQRRKMGFHAARFPHGKDAPSGG